MKWMIPLLFLAGIASGKQVDLKITSFNSSVGKKYLKWKNDGYQAWYLAGWEEYFTKYLNHDSAFLRRNSLSKCGKADVHLYDYSPCMMGAMVHSMQRTLYDVGVPVDLNFTYAYSDFRGYDVACTGNCIPDTAAKWSRSSADIDVIIMPLQRGSHGHTRSSKSGTSTTAMVGGGQQAYAALHLFRHEMAHAFGFNGHLYGGEFTFNRDRKLYPECAEIKVVPYDKSGLRKGCQNRTYVGNWIERGKPCGNRSMGNSNFFGVGFNVPKYGPTFKHIFSCFVEKVGRGPIPIPPPPPAPVPEPKPEPPKKNLHKYCPNWISLVKRYKCEG